MDAGASSSLEFPKQCREFTLSEIHIATKNFDESLVIGRGGFGMVYKGTISDGTTHLVAAIKRLDATSNQGAEEFWSEVRMLSTLRHCHLVSLIGYCNDGPEMILVYEYMSQGTLEDHLHKFQSPLPWVRRLKICIGAARGLDYLHTGTGTKHGIIHRDVKSSNILLDDTWAAKISDFGLSKRGPINQPSTYVKTFVKGTFGYLDPDYYATGRLTRKSDVYAFGVVLLEVLSGKRAVDRSLDEEHWGLANWAQESIKKGRLKQIVDYTITERILPKCLKEFGRLADRCLHSNPKQRPTMFEVVVCLESVLASQEKANHTWHPLGLRIFGKKVPTSPFGSHGEKSGNIIHTQTHTVGGYLDSVLSSANPNLPGSDVSSVTGSGLSPNSKFSYGYASSPGKRSSVEDFYETRIDNVNGEEIGLFGVFDGHGGDRAAKYVKENLFTNLIKHPMLISDTKSAIAEAYSHTDTEFLKSENHQNRDAGSTACTAIIVGNRLLVANVGDSGAVICRGGNAFAVSRDHRPDQSDERRRIEDAGGVVTWEGTWKVGGVLAVSRAFGYKLLKQFVVADPEIQEEKIDESLEFLILATHGLWDVFTIKEAVAMIKPVQSPEEAAKMLMHEASQRGSADNITVVVVRFLDTQDA